jgi:hypothetical protein
MEKYKFINNENIEEKKDSMKKIPIKIFLCIFIITIINNSPINVNGNGYKRRLLKDNILAPYNRYYVSKYFNNTDAEYFNITYIKYIFSYKFKVVKVEYNVVFYDKNDNIIAPSNLSLYNNLHLICHIDVKDTYTIIDSLGYNHQNKYFICIEFFNMHEKITFGIKLYQQFKNEHDIEEDIIKFSTIYLFTQTLFDLNNMAYKNDDMFDPFLINKNFLNFVKDTQNKFKNQTLKLRKYYMEYPNCIIKRNSIIFYNKWVFRNIYNHHFCACKGFNCLDKNVGSYCKFYFYLYIVDNNRNLYEKTDYLFVDLYFKEILPEDTYPVFREMAKQKLPVHYMTERQDIYDEYCKNGTKLCLDVIKIDRDNYTMTGDFFENYLELFLKLKAVVSARAVRSVANVFCFTEYITYIFVGNGLYYFKPFIYMDLKSNEARRFDKVLLPNSEKFASLVKSNGWYDEEIIKINLPRWEKYYRENHKELDNKNKTILIYFNPRDINKDKSISSLYIENIKKLVTNLNLNKQIKKNNVTIYLAFYHTYIFRKNKFKKILENNTNIKVIEQEQIPDYLKTANLLVSDYSTLIFDMIYLGKPIALYIPDIDEPNITDIYRPECSDVIQSLKNGTIEIENLCVDIKKIVDKIIFYIKNNFKLVEIFLNFKSRGILIYSAKLWCKI